jgi:hypothetical protein
MVMAIIGRERAIDGHARRFLGLNHSTAPMLLDANEIQ